MLELLLANHPLDCPVCDKGGECPLQDQAFSHGPGESRYVEEKRHYEKPIPISDLVFLDRERCILCDRCTRFADEVAGDALIHFIHRGNQTQVNTFPDEPFCQLLQRQHRADLPGRRAHRQAVPLQGPAVGPRRDREHVHHVLGRLPHRRAVEPRRAACATRASTAIRSTGAGCATGAGSTSRRSNSDERLDGAARARRPTAIVPTSWNAALDAAAAADQGRDRRRRRREHRRARRRPRHERGRVRLGPPGPRRHRHAERRPRSSATGCPVGVLGLPRATIDEAASATTIVLLGARPEGRAAGPVPAPARRGREAAQPDPRVHPEGDRPDPLRVAHGRLRARARRPRPCATALADADDRRRSSPRARSSIVAGRANLAESSAATVRRCTRCSPRVPGGEGAAGAAPRQRRRRAAGRACGPGTGGLDSARHPAGRGRRQDRVPGAARRRPARATSPTPTSPAGRSPARARIIAVDTFLNELARSSPTSCSPAAAYGEKAGTTTNLEGRVTPRRPEGHRPRHRAPRLDDRRRARAPARHRPRLRLASTTSPPRSPRHVDGLRRRHRRRAATHARRRRSPSRPRHRPDQRRRRSRSADRNSYDFRLVVSRKLYDPAVGTAQSPVARRRSRPVPRVHVTRSTSSRIGVAAGAEVKVVERAGPRVVLPRRGRRPSVLRGTAWVPFNQPGGERRRASID